MKKHSTAFIESRQLSHRLTSNEHDPTYREYYKKVKSQYPPRLDLPLIKDIFKAIALAALCALSIYFLSVPANALRTDVYLSSENWNAALDFSGGTIRTRYFQDSNIDFADELRQEQLDALNNGQPLTIHAQILTFLDDNAVMNYNQDEPREIIILAEILIQQWTTACNKDLPDLLSFFIFDEALAIVYQGNLWTSKGYYEEAAEAIDRQDAIWNEERTSEQMRPDREEEQYFYENDAIRRDQERSAQYEALNSTKNGQNNLSHR